MIRAALLLPLALGLAAAPAAAQSHVLIVSGLGGEPKYVEDFHRWSVSLADAAQKRYAVPADRVTVLGEKPERDPARVDGRATREAILKSLSETAKRAGPGDALFVFLIGHGAGEGEVSRLNLPGPDLSAEDLAAALAPFRTQKVVVVNTASASGGFIEKLSGPNRTVITATQSQMEKNEAIFGRFFVEAITGDGADADKDGKVSMAEAFEYARLEVERDYKEGNRMLTEHALLDDNGDGKGSRQAARSGDGVQARTLFLRGGGAAPSAAGASAELRGLMEQRTRLEGQVEELKTRKDSMPAAQYDAELERLLLELARVGQQIRAKGGSQ